jgi:hypothetical protein
MRYRDLKDERDAAVARAVEAERLSMKSEFDRVTAEFEYEKARMLAAIWPICLRECVRAFRRFGVSASVATHEILNMSPFLFQLTHGAKHTASTRVGFQIRLCLRLRLRLHRADGIAHLQAPLLT